AFGNASARVPGQGWRPVATSELWCALLVCSMAGKCCRKRVLLALLGGAVERSIPTLFAVLLLVHFSSDWARAQSSCSRPESEYVVVGVPLKDPLGGLAVRAAPEPSAKQLGVIPASGTGIGTTNCTAGGWCEVNYCEARLRGLS